MKAFNKSWLMTILAILMVFGVVLAGCSSDGGSSDQNNGGNNEEETGGGGNEGAAGGSDEGTTEGSGDSGGGGGLSGTLEIQYFVGGYGDQWMKTIIKDFKAKHPDLKIKEYAGPKINKQMKTRWISGDPPDVVYIDGAGSSPTQMVEDGLLLDITDWYKSLKLPDGTPLSDALIVPPSTYDGGKIYSIPFVFDTWGTWYDAAWFEEKGWKVPSDYQSWMDSMQTIKEEADIYPFVTTGKYPYYFLRGVMYPAIASAGGDELLAAVINGEKGAWSSDEVLGVMKKVQKMVDKGYVDPGFAALNHTHSQAAFLQHKNAYIPVGFWLPNEMKKSTPEGFEFGFIPTPMNDKGDPMVVVPKNPPMAIAKEADNKKAAKAFLKFMFQKKYAKVFAETAGAMANIKGVDLASDPKVPGYLVDFNKMFSSGDVAVHHKPHPMSADLETPISNAIVKLLLGEMSAEEFCQKAEAAAKEYRNSQ